MLWSVFGFICFRSTPPVVTIAFLNPWFVVMVSGVACSWVISFWVVFFVSCAAVVFGDIWQMLVNSVMMVLGRYWVSSLFSCLLPCFCRQLANMFCQFCWVMSGNSEIMIGTGVGFVCWMREICPERFIIAGPDIPWWVSSRSPW